MGNYDSSFFWALSSSEGGLTNLSSVEDESSVFSSRARADDSHPYFRSTRQKILNREFQFIIFGSGHRNGVENKLHFWNEICKTYGDYNIWPSKLLIRRIIFNLKYSNHFEISFNYGWRK